MNKLLKKIKRNWLSFVSIIEYAKLKRRSEIVYYYIYMDDKFIGNVAKYCEKNKLTESDDMDDQIESIIDEITENIEYYTPYLAGSEFAEVDAQTYELGCNFTVKFTGIATKKDIIDFITPDLSYCVPTQGSLSDYGLLPALSFSDENGITIYVSPLFRHKDQLVYNDHLVDLEFNYLKSVEM